MGSSWDIVVETFGSENLVRYGNESTPDRGLPDEAWQYARTIGLPAVPMFGFDFSALRTLPAVRTVVGPPSRSECHRVWLSGYCVGVNNRLFFVVMPVSGQIWLLDLVTELAPMLVNSGLGQLGLSLAGYARIVRTITDSPEERARQFKKSVVEYDSIAISDPSSWWTTVIEEMRIGLL